MAGLPKATSLRMAVLTRVSFGARCVGSCSETTGTLFYGLKTSPETVLLALSMLAEGLDPQATARVLSVKEATVHWLELASEHVEAVSAYLMQELHLSQVQVDEMWSLLGKRDEEQPEHRKTRWFWSAMASDSKLWLAYLIADRSLDAAQGLIHPKPALEHAGVDRLMRFQVD